MDFEVSATVREPALTEISGIVTADGPRFLVHNDEGKPDIFVLDSSGALRSRFRLESAKNRDWEDVTWVPHRDLRLLAIGDIGDNLGLRSSIRIYFVDLPEPGPGGAEAVTVATHHVVDLTYPDGPRDCEAMAYDPASGMVLLLSKRDKPPRLYGVDAARALGEARLRLEHLGEATRFRPPTRDDMRRLGRDGAWVSQPTGMDINDDGTLAAVISYRSLYLFARAAGETWAEALQKPPREFLGPPSSDVEAIAFGPGMQELYITSEGSPAPIYYAALPAPD